MNADDRRISGSNLLPHLIMNWTIGTAGSTTLVLQTVLPALWMHGVTARLVIEGGTHNPQAPSANFIAEAFLPVLARMGLDATFNLDSHGFYPAGGGSIRVETITGPVDLKIPRASNTGSVLRLRGRGVAGPQGQRGDHLVELRVMLPDNADTELERIVSEWETKHPYNPRRGPGGAP